MLPRVLLESSRGQFWKNCRNRVRGAVLEHPPNLPARCFRHTRQAQCRHVSDLPPEPSPTWPSRRILAVGFSRATNKLHAIPPWLQEWIATRPSSGPSIWAALHHRTVVRSGLQCHRKVSCLRMVVELPATAMPPHGPSARASLLSKPSRCHRAIGVPAHHRPRTGAISTESRLTQLVHSTCWQSLITPRSRPPLPLITPWFGRN